MNRVVNLMRQVIKRTLAGVLPRQRLLVSGPRRPTAADRRGSIEIALTFDDGPHPEWTPPVLEELSQVGWKGTFFVIGERAAAHPDLVRRIVEEGHAIGNHTFTHSPPVETPVEKLVDEVQRTHQLIADLTGESTRLVRPPQGRLTRKKFAALWSTRQSIVLWNVDPKDFAMQRPADASAWAQSYSPSEGDVVLLHDRLPYAAEIVRRLSHQHGGRVRSVALTDWLPPHCRSCNAHIFRLAATQRGALGAR